MESKAHWERIYESKGIREVSWFQEHAAQSIELIKKTGVNLGAKIIDVGGGASTLVDDLLTKLSVRCRTDRANSHLIDSKPSQNFQIRGGRP